MLLALVTVVSVAATLVISDVAQLRRFLMPGPLVSAHSAIEDCGGCHTKSGSGRLSWLHGLVAGDPGADSKACLVCHKMPDTAFNPHGAPADALKRSTERLRKFVAAEPAPAALRAQSRAFPTHDMVAGGLHCATCHQEHQGVDIDLGTISNAQCQSCHVVQFDSFDGQHPKFDSYPFRRRTRIVYDHAGHFDKHFPEVAKKDPSRRIPATCAICHDSRQDKRIMAVAPFEQTCATCHRDQITGKERVSGPKGIAFLSLPGLDLQTLSKWKASIGEWPQASEAELTPFMKLLIGGNERGRTLIRAVDGLSLQDLGDASDAQINAVSELVWEIKRLIYALIKERTSDVLGGLDLAGKGKLEAALVADLTQRIPRDVLVAAQQRWLPNLAAEMAAGAGASDPQQSGWSTVTSGPASPAEATATEAAAAEPVAPEESPGSELEQDDTPRRPAAAGATKGNSDGQGCLVRVLGQCLVQKAPKQDAGAAIAPAASQPASTASTASGDGQRLPANRKLPAAMRAGLQELRTTAQAGALPSNTGAAAGRPEAGVPTGKPPQAKSTAGGATQAVQSDDLLFPTEREREEIRAHGKLSGRPPRSDKAPAGAAAAPDTAPAIQPAKASAGAGIASEVDPESWAEAGGWYQQDHAIYYRPAGHKDKFITSWLVLTGPRAPTGDTGPAAAVFDALTGKDAQGSCTKCHSVDAVPGGGRTVNFSPASVAGKQGRFTRFVHEPHFVAVGKEGCLACHELERSERYLKSYAQGDPRDFAAEFGTVPKDRCQSCHTRSKARQDCLLCHTYHVDDVITPIPGTKVQAR
ncbi:MAG: hypothetical protein AB1749_12115 [Pseudomonadota bacterium]